MDKYDAGSGLEGSSNLVHESDTIKLQRDKRQEQDEHIMAGREARRLESDLRRRESEVANLERRIKASKENLRYVLTKDTAPAPSAHGANQWTRRTEW